MLLAESDGNGENNAESKPFPGITGRGGKRSLEGNLALCFGPLSKSKDGPFTGGEISTNCKVWFSGEICPFSNQLEKLACCPAFSRPAAVVCEVCGLSEASAKEDFVPTHPPIFSRAPSGVHSPSGLSQHLGAAYLRLSTTFAYSVRGAVCLFRSLRM